MSSLLRTTGQSGAGADVSEVFSTDLWSGTGSSQTINNGINLSGEGGMFWAKARNSTDYHYVFDTERIDAGGRSNSVSTNVTDAEFAHDSHPTATSSGYHTGTSLSGFTIMFAGWTFRRSPRFFDFVTYTGDSTYGRTISHNLGVEPGMIVVKRRDSTGDWPVYHKDSNASPGQYILQLNDNAATYASTMWANVAPSDSDFTVGNNAAVNASGGTYVAYLFAHDTEDDGIIQCGSYTGNNSTQTITLGWQPQYVLLKRKNATGNWVILDTQRSWEGTNTSSGELRPNVSNAEEDFYTSNHTSTGFNVSQDASDNFNVSGGSYIYMAIRAEGV